METSPVGSHAGSARFSSTMSNSSLEALELRAESRDLLLRLLTAPGLRLPQPGLLLPQPGLLLPQPGLLLAALLSRGAHLLEARDELVALEQQRRPRVEPE